MPVTIHKRGKIWHYRGTAAGRRLRGTTGTTEKALAQRIAADAEAKEWRRHLDGSGAQVTMAQAAIAYRLANKSTRFLEKIEDHWKDTLIRNITGEAIRQSARKLYPAAKGATHNRQVIVPTQAVINFSAALGWCSTIKVKRFPVDPKVKTPATREWVSAFVEHASPHLGALCLFMFGTGARIGEATALTWQDVDLFGRKATICQTKVLSTRTAHLPPRVVAAIANIPSNHRLSDRVFGYAGTGSVKQPWANAIQRAGIEHLTPHCCRHGFATAMLRANFDVKTVAKLGGWKDATTVLRTYAHALDDPTLTDALFDTPVAQVENDIDLTGQNKRKNSP
jgi:integrase